MAYRETPFHGRLARVEKNNVAVGYSTMWGCDINLDEADKTAQGDNWASSEAGIGHWGGTMEFYLVLGDAGQIALANNIVNATPGTVLTDMKFLMEDSTHAITGNIRIIKFSTTPSITGGMAKANFSFSGQGAPSITDAA